MNVVINKKSLPFSVPLPIYSQFEIGTMENKLGEKFIIAIGLSRDIAEDIKRKSLDESDTELMEGTSDKARFGEGSYEEWYGKGRVPFALIHEKTGALAALAWFGPKPLGRKSLKHLSPEERTHENEAVSDEWHTIVYRSYLPFRGTGLMSEFAGTTLEVYAHYFPKAKFWGGVSRKNIPSIKLSEKMGFIADESHSDSQWVLMIRT